MWNKKMRLLSPFHKSQMLLHGINQQFPRGAFGIEHSYRHVAGAAPLLCKHHTKGETTKHEGAKRATSVSISEDPPCARFFRLANLPEL